MKYIAAYAMVAISGKEVTAEAIKKVLSSVECNVDESRLNQLVDALKGKALHEVISAGLGKVSNLAPSSGAAAPASGAAPAQEEKKEEKKVEEEEEEDDVDMGDLFGDF